MSTVKTWRDQARDWAGLEQKKLKILPVLDIDIDIEYQENTKRRDTCMHVIV